jgi:hypothetical protein
MQSTKTECLSRARELIGGGAAHRLRYAALELRLCIELMTFEKLNSAPYQDLK